MADTTLDLGGTNPGSPNPGVTGIPYKTLDESCQQIRLLELIGINPTSQQVECKLLVASLKSIKPFTALSYIWGDANIRKPILVNDIQHEVTVNFESALRDVISYFNSEQVTEERYVWADAICINQADKNEKNSQIQLMASIYSTAQLTLSYLGRDPLVSLSIQRLNLIVQQLIERNFTGQNPSNQTRSRRGSDVVSSNQRIVPTTDPSSYSHRADDFISWMEEFPEFCSSDAPRNSDASEDSIESDLLNEAECFSSFADHAYWGRAWILQETVLSTHILFLSGQHSISYEWALKASRWFQLLAQSPRPSFISSTYWSSMVLTSFYRLDYVQEYKTSREKSLEIDGLSSVVQNIEGFSEATKAKLHACKVSLETNHELDLLNSIHRFKATDPRDRIYALVAVHRSKFPVDYNLKEPGEVFYRFCKYLMEKHTMTMEIRRQFNNQPEHSVLTKLLCRAGIGFEPARPKDLPTWIPDFASLGIFNHMSVWLADGNSSFDAAKDLLTIKTLVSSETVLETRIEEKELIACGLNLCTVSQVWNGSATQEDLSMKNLPETKRVLIKSCRDFVCRLPSEHPGVHPVLQLFKTICQTNPTRELIAGFLWVLRSGDTDEEFEEFVYAASSIDGYTQPQNHKGHRSDFVRRMIVLSFLQQYIPRRENPTTLTLDKTMAGFVSTSKMFETDDGRLGRAPPLVIERDIICIIEGCDVPVILRRRSEKDYSFVGVCFIEGLMQGEAAQRAKAEGLGLEEFAIS